MTLIELDLPCADLEVRSVSERIIGGIIVPWDTPALVERGRAVEVFRRGALSKTIQERSSSLPLYVRHDKMSPIGRLVDARDDTVGHYAEFRISKTPRGDEMLELASDGVMDGFSVGFVPIEARTKRERDETTGLPLYVRSEVKLDHVGLLPSGSAAYQTARVVTVREDEELELEERARAEEARARAEARKRARSRMLE